MAFLHRAGSILRQTVSKHINHEITASSPSIFQVIRCMSSSRVFIGGLSYSTDDSSLREAFDKYGEVFEARVIVDRETGRSRGFGFVTYANSEEASSAIQALDGRDLHGRMIKVNYANERTRSPGFGGGGGYGGGGYGGGGGGYGGGSSGYGSGGNFSGVGGNDNYASGGAVGGTDFAAGSSYGGNPSSGYSGEDQFGNNESSNTAAASGEGGSYRDDDDDEPGDFANRRT